MKSVVITGSTRGIGYGLAEQFLARGCQVTINGRSQSSVDRACGTLSKKFEHKNIIGSPGSVSDLDDMQTLWDITQKRFGKIDIWINNAGLSQDMECMWDLPPERVKAIVEANILGMMYASRVAIRGMLSQGHGQLYNMEGFGSDGHVRDGLSIYGTTKVGVRYFSKVLVSETKGKPIQICTLSPGMVITDMLMAPYRNDPEAGKKAKRIFNILADKPEPVTAWLTEKVLANNKTGAHYAWLTRPKIFWRFMTAPFNKRDLFADEPQAVAAG